MPYADPETGNKRKKARRAGNPEAARARDKAYYIKNREKIIARANAFQANNMDRVRDMRLRRELGITGEFFNSLIAHQGGRCSICWRKAKLVADHNHETGEFRGAICSGCNSGLGYFDEHLLTMIGAMRYLIERGSKHDDEAIKSKRRSWHSETKL